MRNQFHTFGPKQIFRQANLSPTMAYVRVTMPGVAFGSLHVSLDSTKRWVLLKGKEEDQQMRGPHGIPTRIAGRSYEGALGFDHSRCCFIIADVSFNLQDGILRLFIQKRFIAPNPCPNCTEKIITERSGEIFIDEHPLVMEGEAASLQTTVAADGGIIGRADVEGAKQKEMSVWIANGRLRFHVEFQEDLDYGDWCEYFGDLGIPQLLADTGEEPIWEVANGVLRFRILPGNSMKNILEPADEWEVDSNLEWCEELEESIIVLRESEEMKMTVYREETESEGSSSGASPVKLSEELVDALVAIVKESLEVSGDFLQAPVSVSNEGLEAPVSVSNEGLEAPVSNEGLEALTKGLKEVLHLSETVTDDLGVNQHLSETEDQVNEDNRSKY